MKRHTGEKKPDTDQYHRFLKTAREVEAEETEESFDRAFTKVVASKPSPRKRDR